MIGHGSIIKWASVDVLHGWLLRVSKRRGWHAIWAAAGILLRIDLPRRRMLTVLWVRGWVSVCILKVRVHGGRVITSVHRRQEGPGGVLVVIISLYVVRRLPIVLSVSFLILLLLYLICVVSGYDRWVGSSRVVGDRGIATGFVVANDRWVRVRI